MRDPNHTVPLNYHRRSAGGPTASKNIHEGPLGLISLTDDQALQGEAPRLLIYFKSQRHTGPPNFFPIDKDLRES
jgi:hypothetical protein